MRKIIAVVEVDDNTAFNEINDGPIAYLEKEFGWLEESGIRLLDSFIADDDEDDVWQAYINYLVEWSFDHTGSEFKGMTPASFDEWYENEFDGEHIPVRCKDCIHYGLCVDWNMYEDLDQDCKHYQVKADKRKILLFAVALLWLLMMIPQDTSRKYSLPVQPHMG